MEIDFSSLFVSESETKVIDCHFTADDFLYDNGSSPLRDGIDVHGSAYSKADVIHMDLDISFAFYGMCDRCGDDFKKDFEFFVNKIIVASMQNEKDDFDDYVVTENNVIDLKTLVFEEIYLFLPAKMLCREDCKGLCPQCGKNLNYQKCDCKAAVDPRMSALLQLLNSDDNCQNKEE